MQCVAAGWIAHIQPLQSESESQTPSCELTWFPSVFAKAASHLLSWFRWVRQSANQAENMTPRPKAQSSAIKSHVHFYSAQKTVWRRLGWIRGNMLWVWFTGVPGVFNQKKSRVRAHVMHAHTHTHTPNKGHIHSASLREWVKCREDFPHGDQ